jgi:hypothetical protein
MDENKGFDFPKFIDDSKSALLNPKEHFAKLETQGGLAEPLIKALIYGAIAGIFTMLWSFLHIGSAAGGMLGGAVGVSAFFFSIIGAVIGAFIGGVIVLVLSSICSGNADYEANLRVAVALMVIFPVSSFLNVLGGLNHWLNTIVNLGVNLYSLYMLYWALTLTLKGKEQTAKTIGFVLGGIVLFFLLISLLFGSAARFGARHLEGKLSQYEDELKKYESVAEEMAAKYEAEAAEMENEEVDEESSEISNPKPDVFPQKAFDYSKDWFEKGAPLLTADKLDNLILATDEFKAIDRTEADKALKIIQTYGFKDIEDYTKCYSTVVFAMEGVKSLQAMQIIMEASEKEQKASEVFTLDKAFESALKQIIAGAKLTKADVKFAYDNWDKVNELIDKGKTN